MRQMLRNTQTIHYKNYVSKTALTDTEGLNTGEYELTYGTMQSADVCVSSGYGASSTEEFGQFADYDRTITSADPDFAITEQSIVWIDAATTGTHDYIVTRVSRWKNSTTVALRRVEVA